MGQIEHEDPGDRLLEGLNFSLTFRRIDEVDVISDERWTEGGRPSPVPDPVGTNKP